MTGQQNRCSTRSKRSTPRDTASDRGLSPVVGKTLELGIGVLLVALLTATLFGGLVPDYRTAVGDELGERTLVAGAERTEAAVPERADAERRVTVRLPPTIRGDPYRIVVEKEPNAVALRLVHPDRAIGGRVRLAIPAAASVSGSWTSTSPSRVLVSATGRAGRIDRPDRSDRPDRTDGPERTLSVRLVDVEGGAPAATAGPSPETGAPTSETEAPASATEGPA